MHPKYLYLLLLSVSFGLFAQNNSSVDTLKIKIKPVISNRIVLYSAYGSKQKYVSYDDSENGEFNLSIPKNQHKGIYRLVFDQKTMNYIDFLYLGEEFEIQFDPTKPEKAPLFKGSNTNTRYYENLNNIVQKQQILDSLQVLCFQEKDSITLQGLNEKYIKQQKLVAAFLSNLDKTEGNRIIRDLIKANARIQPEKPIENPEEYLPFVKKHYFDSIDFNNENLIHSSILIDKVMDYVFYLTVSRDPETQNNLYKKAVSDVLQRVDNKGLRSGFIQALLQSFAKEENIVLTDFLFTEYYNKLPLEHQNLDFKNDLQQELKTAIGRTASEITWKEKDSIIKLSELKNYDNYIIVFWSTTCPHCMKEIPKLYEYTKDKKNIKVLAIGMETEESQGIWRSETYYYPEFTHILGLGKWENSIARSYNVFATPSYFVLDTDKKIIDKPYELIDLKVFFKGLK
jgi:thiol-disulfide isomerase/thioredoxin